MPEEGAPYGRKPKEVLDVFLAEAKANGFRTGIVGDRTGWVEYGSGEKLLGIICHLDVVPVTDDWDSDPFTLTFREDEADGEVMYARGIVDDKGPVCASFFAMKELFDQGHIPANCRVRLILGTDEERTCSCIQYYTAHGEVPDFSITPDSVFPVVFSEKGILQLRIYGGNEKQLTAHGGTAVNIVPDSAHCVAAGRELRAVGKAAHALKLKQRLHFQFQEPLSLPLIIQSVARAAAHFRLCVNPVLRIFRKNKVRPLMESNPLNLNY